MRHLLPPCLLHSYSFLFKGDGRAVAIQAHTRPADAQPRASFDRSLPPSYSRRASADSFQTQTINTPRRQRSTDSQGESDSGHPPSPLSSSISPPPAVDLKSHPNRRRLSGSIHRSSPRDITYENTEIDSGFRDMSASVDSCLGGESMFDMENGSLDDRLSYMDDLATGSMDERDFQQRHPTLPSSLPRRIRMATHRSNSTATCKPSQHAQEYIEMMHPRAAQAKDSYVFMQPVGPIQLDGSPPRSLSPITETEPRKNRFVPSSYENHMLPSEMAGQKYVMYQRPYENVEPAEGAFSISSGKSPRSQPVRYVEGQQLTPPVMVQMPSVS